MNANRPSELRPDDDLTAAVAAALRSREPSADWTASSADRIAAQLRDSGPRPVLLPRHAGRIAVTGVAASALVVGVGVGAAAAKPYSGYAAGVEDVARSVGLHVSFMPPGYTREEYDAFWNAGYTGEDVDALAKLWHTDSTTTKARAGQMLLDHEPLPLPADPTRAPATPPPTVSADEEAEYEAVAKAGYTPVEVQELADLWHTEYMEAKAHAGQLLLEGKPLPINPPPTQAPAGN